MKILSVNLKERAKAYQDIFALFGFLTNLNISHEDLKTNVQKIMEQYSDDIDEALYNELIHLQNYIKLTCKSENLPISHLSLYKIIKEKKKGNCVSKFRNNFKNLFMFDAHSLWRTKFFKVKTYEKLFNINYDTKYIK